MAGRCATWVSDYDGSHEADGDGGNDDNRGAGDVRRAHQHREQCRRDGGGN